VLRKLQFPNLAQQFPHGGIAESRVVKLQIAQPRFACPLVRLSGANLLLLFRADEKVPLELSYPATA